MSAEQPVTRRERFYGWLTHRLLIRCAKLAEARGDHHELRHIGYVFLVGNSTHTAKPCPLPPEAGR